MKEFEIQREFFKNLISGDKYSIYREIVFNNIDDTCSKAFPIARSVLKEKWNRLIEDFIRSAEFRTPYLWEIPREFINFLQRKKVAEKYGIEFLYDLLRYEWIEMELFNQDLPKGSSQFGWDKKMFLSHTALLERFEYPVHRIGDLSLDDLKNLRGKYFLIIYTSPKDYEVSYFQITEFLYDILKRSGNKTMIEVVNEVSESYNVDLQEIIEDLENFFITLCKEKILI